MLTVSNACITTLVESYEDSLCERPEAMTAQFNQPDRPFIGPSDEYVCSHRGGPKTPCRRPAVLDA
jgi:hypothetical protein